jgi:biopolymer transport protein ExbD
MAELNLAVNEGRRAGIRHRKLHHPKTDMTPMVDLGFLLITFFVFTAEITKPKAMHLYMPHDGPPTPTQESKTMTILLGDNNKLYYYTGKEENRIHETSYDEKTGIGKIIREKQFGLEQNKMEKNELMIVIKAGNNSSYKNSVDILDEMIINNVTRYAITKLSEQERSYLEKQNN